MSESPHTPGESVSDDVMHLRDITRALWEGKWIVGGITAIAAASAIIVALLLPNVYRAEALLAPNEQDGAGGLSALASQYGGLASLAGIELGGKADKTALGLEVLKSRKFISEFVERHDILVPLIAARGWDAGTGQLKIDADDYDEAAGKWIREVAPPKKTVPSAQEAFEEFRDRLSILQDKTTGFVTVTFEHYSPDVARQWLDWLIKDLNSSMMQKDVSEAEQAIEYLHRQIEMTSISDLRAVFFNLIEEQTKTVMLATVTDEYLFKTIDPAVVPELKSSPKRALIVVVATLLGFFLASILVLIIKSRR